MERLISATDANREFSRLLGEVAGGETYVVTARGKPMMRMTPVFSDEKGAAERQRKLHQLLDDMGRLPLRHAGRITREDGYD